MPAPHPASLPDEVRKALDAYAERLAELLDACARDQERAPEAFLWNARRALEAMVLMLASVHSGKVRRLERDNALHGLIQELVKEGVLPRQHEIGFNAARDFANLGVHIRGPEREDYRTARDSLGQMLPGLVEWLYTDSPVAPFVDRRWQVDALNAALDIKQGGRTEQLPAPSLPPPPPPPAPTPARPRSRYWLPGGLALASLVASAAVSFGALEGWRGTGTAQAVAALGTPGATPARGSAPTPAVTAALVTRDPAPAPPAPPPACPAGMVGVAARTVHLGQPIPARKDWPTPTRPELDPTPVAAFCIDATARSAAELAAWAAGRLEVSAGCDWREAGASGRAVCVNRDEASAFCAQALPGGRLPTLLEWEALARAPEAEAVELPVRREWAADAFPPAALGLAWPDDGQERPADGLFRQPLEGRVDPDGNLLHGWNRQRVAHRWRNLGFRCAADPA